MGHSLAARTFFLKGKPEILAVNTTRWKLLEKFKALGLPIEVGSGGLTKFNRIKRNLPKAHWIDAACVGQNTPEVLNIADIKQLQIKSTGHGKRQMCRVDKIGRIVVRISGYFNITANNDVVQGISYESCLKLHGCDGYNYITS